jgi:hypothetical protein
LGGGLQDGESRWRDVVELADEAVGRDDRGFEGDLVLDLGVVLDVVVGDVGLAHHRLLTLIVEEDGVWLAWKLDRAVWRRRGAAEVGLVANGVLWRHHEQVGDCRRGARRGYQLLGVHGH